MTSDIFQGMNPSITEVKAMIERAEHEFAAGKTVRIWNCYGDQITIIGGPSPLGWRFNNGKPIPDLSGVFL